MIRHAPIALRRLLPSFRSRPSHAVAASTLLAWVLLATAAAAQTPAPATPAAPLPRLLVITTGGTIGLNGIELVEAVPQLATIADLEVEQFVSFGSSSMRPENWVGLSR